MKRKSSSESLLISDDTAFLKSKKIRRINFIPPNDPSFSLSLQEVEELFAKGFILKEEYLTQKNKLENDVSEEKYKEDTIEYGGGSLISKDEMDVECAKVVVPVLNESKENKESFKKIAVKEELNKGIERTALKYPTSIQSECLPYLIQGKSVFCQSQCASGKTTLLVLTALQQINPEEKETFALIICPTAELVYQTTRQIKSLGTYFNNLCVESFYGGTSFSCDLEKLKIRTPQISIGTLGRIMHLVESNSLNLSSLKLLMLDECEQFVLNSNCKTKFDLLFEKVKNGLSQLVMTCSSILSTEELAKFKSYFGIKNLKDPFFLTESNFTKLISLNISHYYVTSSKSSKLKMLPDLLDNIDFCQAMIFVSYISNAEFLFNVLVQNGFPCVLVHSKRLMDERIQTLQSFSDFKSRIMVTTDLMSLGMQFEKVNLVINYDMPNSTRTYLNRAGRIQCKGAIVNFISISKSSDQRSLYLLTREGLTISPLSEIKVEL